MNWSMMVLIFGLMVTQPIKGGEGDLGEFPCNLDRPPPCAEGKGHCIVYRRGPEGKEVKVGSGCADECSDGEGGSDPESEIQNDGRGWKCAAESEKELPFPCNLDRPPPCAEGKGHCIVYTRGPEGNEVKVGSGCADECSDGEGGSEPESEIQNDGRGWKCAAESEKELPFPCNLDRPPPCAEGKGHCIVYRRGPEGKEVKVGSGCADECSDGEGGSDPESEIQNDGRGWKCAAESERELPFPCNLDRPPPCAEGKGHCIVYRRGPEGEKVKVGPGCADECSDGEGGSDPESEIQNDGRGWKCAAESEKELPFPCNLDRPPPCAEGKGHCIVYRRGPEGKEVKVGPGCADECSDGEGGSDPESEIQNDGRGWKCAAESEKELPFPCNLDRPPPCAEGKGHCIVYRRGPEGKEVKVGPGCADECSDGEGGSDPESEIQNDGRGWKCAAESEKELPFPCNLDRPPPCAEGKGHCIVYRRGPEGKEVKVGPGCADECSDGEGGSDPESEIQNDGRGWKCAAESEKELPFPCNLDRPPPCAEGKGHCIVYKRGPEGEKVKVGPGCADECSDGEGGSDPESEIQNDGRGWNCTAKSDTGAGQASATVIGFVVIVVHYPFN